LNDEAKLAKRLCEDKVCFHYWKCKQRTRCL
jgi:hypothetical protein